MARMTSSGPSGRSRSEAYAGRPRTSPPRPFTRYTARRCSPCSRRALTSPPHFVRSLDAPTTATERGAKSGVRSRGPASGASLPADGRGILGAGHASLSRRTASASASATAATARSTVCSVITVEMHISPRWAMNTPRLMSARCR